MAALKEAARKGRRGDTRLGHLSNGDVVIPREILDEKSRKLVNFFLKTKGHESGRFTVGHEDNQRNPRTRLPEFEGTGAEGSGEGPGAAGGVGGTGPGGGGTGGPGNGASAGSEGASSGVASSSALDGMATPDPTATDTTTGQLPSQTVVDAKTTPAVSDTSLGNTIANNLQSKVSEFNFDPVSTLAALGINLGVGMIPGIGQVASLANLAAGLMGHDLGHSVVNGVSGMMNGGVSAGTPTGVAGAGGDIGGGAGLDSLGGNIGTGFDDSLLKRRLRES